MIEWIRRMIAWVQRFRRNQARIEGAMRVIDAAPPISGWSTELLRDQLFGGVYSTGVTPSYSLYSPAPAESSPFGIGEPAPSSLVDPDRCPAEYVQDVMGSTLHCELDKGHAGPHQDRTYDLINDQHVLVKWESVPDDYSGDEPQIGGRGDDN